MMMGFLSEKVAKTVYEAFGDASRKRYQQIGKTIDETLKDGDIALLFIREGHMVQFPQDVDVFSVPRRPWMRYTGGHVTARPGREKEQNKPADSSTS